jgi:hypothetical protein
VLIALPDGRSVPVPAARVRTLLEVLVELYDRDSLRDDALPMSRWDAGQLGSLDTWQWSGGEDLRELARPAPLPAAGPRLAAVPARIRLGGILADDMGLGKTVQVLAHLLVEKRSGRPTAPAWWSRRPACCSTGARGGALRPRLAVLVLHGAAPRSVRAGPRRGTTWCSPPTRCCRATPRSCSRSPSTAHPRRGADIKNPRARRAGRARAARAPPPVPDRHAAGEPSRRAVGAVRLPDARLLGDARRSPPVPHADREARRRRRARALARRVAPVPAAPHQGRGRHRAAAQDRDPARGRARGRPARALRDLRLAVHEKVREAIARKGLARSGIEILDALLKLRQVCCDPRLVKLERAPGPTRSAKLDC